MVIYSGAGTFSNIFEVWDKFDKKNASNTPSSSSNTPSSSSNTILSSSNTPSSSSNSTESSESSSSKNSCHWAIKIVKKRKCVSTEPDGRIYLDREKYFKYTNFLSSEGKRIMHLNSLDPSETVQIIQCRELLYPPFFVHKQIDDEFWKEKPYINQQFSLPLNIGPCMVMELMGISLLKYVQIRNKYDHPILLKTVRYIAIQLFNALSFLHTVGWYVHSDLKPENILLTIDHCCNDNFLMTNQYPNIKIADFGNALRYGTRIKSFQIQSLFYRAPEVLFGIEYTSAVDLWSVGCILLELVNFNAGEIYPYFYKSIFGCCNAEQLCYIIQNILGPYPRSVYNKFNAFYFNNLYGSFCQLVGMNPNDPEKPNSNSNSNPNKNIIFTENQFFYNSAKNERKIRIQNQLKHLYKKEQEQKDFMNELDDFVDLLSSLLDTHPATRFTADDAIRHSFCLDPKYVQNDTNTINLLQSTYKLENPNTLTDFDRQTRIIAQNRKYNDLISKNLPLQSKLPLQPEFEFETEFEPKREPQPFTIVTKFNPNYNDILSYIHE